MEKRKFKIRICKECNRKRRIFDLGYRHPGNDTYHMFECSQGHKWEYKISKTEEVSLIMKKFFEDKVRNIFDRDDTFFKSIK